MMGRPGKRDDEDSKKKRGRTWNRDERKDM